MAAPNHNFGDAAGVAIAAGATALPFPPVVCGAVPASWTANGAIPELDVEIWANATTNLTAAELYGGTGQLLVNADDTFTAVGATEIFTAASHGLQTGDGPFRVSNSGGALPAGLSATTDYWIIIIDANTFYLALSLALALGGATNKVLITSDGTGTQTLAASAATERIHWNSLGLLGHARDGAVGLTLAKSYQVRCLHHPRYVAYAVSATLSAANATTVTMFPVQSR
jgi:hypothetical protein